MLRLIHMSDLHFAPLPPVSWRALCGKRLIAYINWQSHRKHSMSSGVYAALCAHIRKQDFQHLAISGDLVNLALPQEFINARAQMEKLGAPRDVSLVFGNHDAYVPGALAQAGAVFAPWIKGDAAKGEEFAAEEEAAEPRAAFPYMRVRGPLALIGVSSAIATPPFCAAGYFGAAQAVRLSAALRRARERNLFRAVMIHHPPLFGATQWQKKLWGIRRFHSVLAEEGAELVLHGHTHLPSLSFLPGRPSAANARGRVAVVGVSSAAQEFGGRKPPAGYNLLEIDKSDSGSWRCVLQRFALVNPKNAIARVERQVLLG